MSAQNRQVIFQDEEEAGDKLSRKAKDSPFMVIGEWKKIIKNSQLIVQ